MVYWKIYWKTFPFTNNLFNVTRHRVAGQLNRLKIVKDNGLLMRF